MALRHTTIRATSALSLLPPRFLLPIRSSRYLSTTAQHVEPITHPNSTTAPTKRPIHPATKLRSSSPLRPSNFESSAVSSADVPLAASVKELLPLLTAQPAHFINIHIHAKPYLVTVGDMVRLPFLMPDVEPGDTLRLDRAIAIGSRDYTLKGTPYIDERLFVCRARVIGTESEPLRIKEKKKRRERRITKVASKHRYTILRISELQIRTLEEVEMDLTQSQKLPSQA